MSLPTVNIARINNSCITGYHWSGYSLLTAASCIHFREWTCRRFRWFRFILSAAISFQQQHSVSTADVSSVLAEGVESRQTGKKCPWRYLSREPKWQWFERLLLGVARAIFPCSVVLRAREKRIVNKSIKPKASARKVQVYGRQMTDFRAEEVWDCPLPYWYWWSICRDARHLNLNRITAEQSPWVTSWQRHPNLSQRRWGRRGHGRSSHREGYSRKDACSTVPLLLNSITSMIGRSSEVSGTALAVHMACGSTASKRHNIFWYFPQTIDARRDSCQVFNRKVRSLVKNEKTARKRVEKWLCWKSQMIICCAFHMR